MTRSQAPTAQAPTAHASTGNAATAKAAKANSATTTAGATATAAGTATAAAAATAAGTATAAATATAAGTVTATAAATAARLRVRLFAGLRERAGWGERDLALPPDLAPATPLAIWELLRLGAWPAGLRVAVNQDFAELHQPLEAGDELAFLPPISGG